MPNQSIMLGTRPIHLPNWILNKSNKPTKQEILELISAWQLRISVIRWRVILTISHTIHHHNNDILPYKTGFLLLLHHNFPDPPKSIEKGLKSQKFFLTIEGGYVGSTNKKCQKNPFFLPEICLTQKIWLPNFFSSIFFFLLTFICHPNFFCPNFLTIF